MVNTNYYWHEAFFFPDLINQEKRRGKEKRIKKRKHCAKLGLRIGRSSLVGKVLCIHADVIAKQGIYSTVNMFNGQLFFPYFKRAVCFFVSPLLPRTVVLLVSES